MEPNRAPDPGGILAASLAAILYGSAYVATAFALRTFTPVAAALWRSLIGVAVLATLVSLPRSRSLRPARLPAPSLLRLLVLGLVGGPGFVVALNVSVSLAGASVTAFVAGLYAVLAAVLAIPLLGERPEVATLGAFVLALVGTALLGDLQPGGSTAAGIGAGLAAAILFAVFLVLSRRWSARYDLPGPTVGVATLGLSALGTAAVLLLAPAAGAASPLRPDAITAVVWLGIGPGALAAVLIVAGMRRLPARRASAFLLLNPPTAAIGSWLLLGERLSPLQLLGAGLVLVAMAAASGLGSGWRRLGGSPG